MLDPKLVEFLVVVMKMVPQADDSKTEKTTVSHKP